MNEEPHDLVAPYALDALDEPEREAFERHLAECDECQAQLAELQEATDALAYAAQGPEPPLELRERILEAARRDRNGAKIIPFPKRRWIFPTTAAVAAVAAAVAVAVGLWANSLSNQLDRERSAKESYARAVELLRGGASVTQLADAQGGLVVGGNRNAALVICGLRRAPSGKTYEAWVIRGQVAKPAGLFRGGSGCRPVLLTIPVPAGAVVGVTLERRGGVKQPTQVPLLRSKPV
jgi:anti-sigma-K factor RskA